MSLIKGGQTANILWVEDDQDMREILADELKDAGYTVMQCRNGQEAYEALEHFRADLILCDITMPVMDGYELLRLVREARTELSDVPFVFLSAQDGSFQISQGKYAGADDYLVKPVNFDLMLATVAARIRQVRRIRQQLGQQAIPEAVMDQLPVNAGGPVFQSLGRMFNLITSGIVLLDGEGRALFANIAAQRLLLDCADSWVEGLFKERGAVGVGKGSSAIRAALRAGLKGKDYTEYLSLSRRDGQRDLLVTVCSLDASDGAHDAPSAALFISASERDALAPLKALEAMFQLTPAEGRIAWAFAQGLRPEKIADIHGISLTTVAFHKRNIFQKTHTNRQADLVALLLTLPAALDS